MRRIGLAVVLVVSLALAARAAEAQRREAVPAIGFLSSAPTELFTPLVAAFRDGLNDAGYLEGRNVTIEFGSAAGRYDLLAAPLASLQEDGRVAHRWMSAGADLAAAGQLSHLMR
jgi:putative ABC transport system substrate-binding protein